MRGCACFDSDQGGWQITEEGSDLSSLKPSSDHDIAAGINAVNLEYALR